MLADRAAAASTAAEQILDKDFGHGRDGFAVDHFVLVRAECGDGDMPA